MEPVNNIQPVHSQYKTTRQRQANKDGQRKWMEVKTLIEAHLRAIVAANPRYRNVGFSCNGRRGGGNLRGAGNTRSIAPSLVYRLQRELGITFKDVVYDVGVGCGSVAIQLALLTGAVVIGLDNNPICIEIARLLWDAVSAEWKVRYPSVTVGSCKFGFTDALDFFKKRTAQKWSCDAPDGWGLWPMPTKVWMADLLFGQLSQNIAFELERPENINIEAVGAMSILWPMKRQTRVPAFPKRWTFITDPGMLEWNEDAKLPVFIFSGNSTRSDCPQTAVAAAKRPSEPATVAKDYHSTEYERRRDDGKAPKGAAPRLILSQNLWNGSSQSSCSKSLACPGTTCSRRAPDMPQTCPRHAPDMPQTNSKS